MIYKNRKIIITGTTRGVGKQLVEHFLNQGAYVIGISRSEAKFTDKRYTHFIADIGNVSEVKQVYSEISKKFKSIDILINNAAVLTSQYSLIMPINNVLEMINTNFIGTFLVTRETVKLMRKNEYGRVISIGSMAEKLEPIGDSIYAACKTAITTLSNIMAKEFASYNITCNTLGISAIETDMLNSLPREKVDKIINELPISRYAKINDIINVIDFYSSKESSYITAQSIYLGGIH